MLVLAWWMRTNSKWAAGNDGSHHRRLPMKGHVLIQFSDTLSQYRSVIYPEHGPAMPGRGRVDRSRARHTRTRHTRTLQLRCVKHSARAEKVAEKPTLRISIERIMRINFQINHKPSPSSSSLFVVIAFLSASPYPRPNATTRDPSQR